MNEDEVRSMSPKSLMKKEPAVSHDDNNGASAEKSSDDGSPPEDKHEDLTCRICQMTASESSHQEVLIRPCLCSGTLSHVHMSCLNEWRATYPAAAYACLVCRYPYRVERTALGRFLTNESGLRVTSFLLFVLATLCAGMLAIYVAHVHAGGVDIFWLACQILIGNCDLSWRDEHCRSVDYFSLHDGSSQSFILNTISTFLCHHSLAAMCAESWLVGCAMHGIVGIVLLMNEHFHIYQELGLFNERFARQFLVVCVQGCFSCKSWTWPLIPKYSYLIQMILFGGFRESFVASFNQIRLFGRRFAHTIGETISEPILQHRSRSTSSNN